MRRPNWGRIHRVRFHDDGSLARKIVLRLHHVLFLNPLNTPSRRSTDNAYFQSSTGVTPSYTLQLLLRTANPRRPPRSIAGSPRRTSALVLSWRFVLAPSRGAKKTST